MFFLCNCVESMIFFMYKKMKQIVFERSNRTWKISQELQDRVQHWILHKGMVVKLRSMARRAVLLGAMMCVLCSRIQ